MSSQLGGREQRQRSNERSAQSSAIQQALELRRKRLESNNKNYNRGSIDDEQALLEDSDCENDNPPTETHLPTQKPLQRLAQAGQRSTPLANASNSADALASALQHLSVNSHHGNSSQPYSSATEPRPAASGSGPRTVIAADSGDDFVSASEASSDAEGDLDVSATQHQPQVQYDLQHNDSSNNRSGRIGSSSSTLLSSRNVGSAFAAAASKASTPGPPPPGSLVLGERQEFVLAPQFAGLLYPHQTEGVKWLWSLHAMAGKGGILGDDMGLGKTLQSAAFLAGLLNSRLATRVIVIAPTTLLAQWAKELTVVGLAPLVHRFYGSSAPDRDLALRTIMRGRGVLLTTYGMVLHNAGQLRCPGTGGGYSRRSGDQGSEEDFRWDVMLLDEGHKIKNPKMKLVQELRTVPAKTRVIISGTPIQNNLMELHALMDFCAEGVLGDARYFKKMYEKPILLGQDSGATAREREHSSALAGQLRRRMAPYFLRREKAAVMSEAAAASTAEAAAEAAAAASGVARSSSAGTAKIQQLGLKNDVVVWLRLRPLQQSIYRAFLASDAVKQALNATASPLAALVMLKKIADHPGLISQRVTSAVIAARNSWAARDGRAGDGSGSESASDSGDSVDSFIDDGDADDDDFIDDGSSDEGEGSRKPARRPNVKKTAKASQPRGKPKPSKSAPLPSEEEEGPVMWSGEGDIESALLSAAARGADASCKTVFVLALLEELARGGHRTLIFSQSRVMLDILQAGIKARGLAMLRIDGTVASADERQAVVQRFQTTPAIPVLLLTSQVGGLGLTLTEADRVIIVDPNWNPAIDNQSVDRAYRIGQRKDVVVYRLITCGTVEEKIYQRQVFKGGLSRTGTEEGVQFRYFTGSDLRDLFQVSDEGLQVSATHTQLSHLHSSQRKSSPEVAAHLQFLESFEGCAGISDHDLLFSNKLLNEGRMSKEDEAQMLHDAERLATAAAAAPLPPRRAPSSANSNNTKAGKAATAQAAAELAAKMSDTLLLGRPGCSAASGAATAMDGCEEGRRLLAARRRSEAANREYKSLQATYNAMQPTLPDGGTKMRKRLAELEADLRAARAEVRRLEDGMGAALGEDVELSAAAPTSSSISSGRSRDEAAEDRSGQQAMHQAVRGTAGRTDGSVTPAGMLHSGPGTSSSAPAANVTTLPARAPLDGHLRVRPADEGGRTTSAAAGRPLIDFTFAGPVSSKGNLATASTGSTRGASSTQNVLPPTSTSAPLAAMLQAAAGLPLSPEAERAAAATATAGNAGDTAESSRTFGTSTGVAGSTRVSNETASRGSASVTNRNLLETAVSTSSAQAPRRHGASHAAAAAPMTTTPLRDDPTSSTGRTSAAARAPAQPPPSSLLPSRMQVLNSNPARVPAGATPAAPPSRQDQVIDLTDD